MRHCSASGQHKDSPLSTEGMRQSQLLSFFLSDRNDPIDKIISSSYLRAIESIKPYANKIGVNIEIDDRLRERILSNEPVDDWLEVLEHSFAHHEYYLPGGESSKEATHRANELFKEINDSEDSHFILITHGNLLALILSQFDDRFGFEEWKSMQYPDVYLIHYDDGIQFVEQLWKD